MRINIIILAAALAAGASSGLAASSGREKLRFDANWRFHYGELPGYTAEGGRVITPIAKWETKPADGAAAEANVTQVLDEASSDGWMTVPVGTDVFKGRTGFAWFRAVVDGKPGGPRSSALRLHFESVDDNATVFVNGIRLAHHELWDEAFDVPVGKVWRTTGPNRIAVLVENTAGQGGIHTRSSLEAAPKAGSAALASVKMSAAAWKRIGLPHDFVVGQPFDPNGDRSHGYKPSGIGWYVKTFDLPASDRGRRLSLEFDGVYRDSTVWLNGILLGRHQSGYTSFAYDITGAARFGAANTLTVRADARRNEGWWYEGGGVYRHVWLVKTSPVHVARWGTFVTTNVRGPETAARPDAEIYIRTTVQDEAARSVLCRLESRIVDPPGQTVATLGSSLTLRGSGSTQTVHRFTLPKVRLWSIETPYLYRVVTTVYQGGRAVDTYVTPFGIRTIRFDKDQGFFLNGKPVKIKGTCNHQDFAGIGVALPDRVHEYKIEKLKAMGSNAYRCSHHPYAPEILDACDRLGMLVMDENRKLGDSPEILGQVESMVRRDRNHPSIIMWSMCNEEGRQGTPAGARMFSAMKKVVTSLDTTRPVTCAMNGGWGPNGITMVADLQGFNYNFGAYDGFHADFPNIPAYASETASTLTTRGEYATDRERGYVTSYNATDDTWKSVAERPFMAGSFVWTGFDYRGEPTPYDWPCINSHFGIMDTCGFPKDNYWYYLSWWGSKPVAHVMPHWNWPGKEGQNIDVRVFTNCERVELILNGHSLGFKDVPRFEHVDWQVPYAPGRLDVRGYNNGTSVARDFVETTERPAVIRLRPDRISVTADGEDVSIIAVDILDAKGRVVPTADNQVTFSVAGAAQVIGVGNGDPSSHESDKASARKAFNGHCMVIVQAGTKTGSFTVKASAPGLNTAATTIRMR
ncbi:MAG TPA: beta-galactosidase GalA [Armatimonadota bacterium]|jgi:beta-galactosidase